RELRQLARVAAAEDNVIRLEAGAEHGDDRLDVLMPLLRTALAEARLADVRLERAALVGQVAELHRRDEPVHRESGAEARAEPEEEHLPALVAAERLHRGVVDDPRGLPERGSEVEARPALAEVHRIDEDAVFGDRRGDADRDHVPLPTLDHPEHL